MKILKIIIFILALLLCLNEIVIELFCWWFIEEDGINKQLLQDFLTLILTLLTIIISAYQIIKTQKEQLKQNKLTIELNRHNMLIESIKKDVEEIHPVILSSKIKLVYDKKGIMNELFDEQCKVTSYLSKILFYIVDKEDEVHFRKICGKSLNEFLKYTSDTIVKICDLDKRILIEKMTNNEDDLSCVIDEIYNIHKEHIKVASELYEKFLSDLKIYIKEREEKIIDIYG